MRRPKRATLRAAGSVALLTGMFLMVNTQVVHAASTGGETGDLLAPLNITSSEGVAINGYELNADGGSIVAFKTQALAFVLAGLFTLVRLLVGLPGWAIEVALRFPLLKILLRPAQKAADAYDTVVVDTLGLKGLVLAWGFVFACFMIVRGRVGRGLGEIFLTLLISALAASAFVRPDYLLTQDGPLGQAQQVAAEVAQQSVTSYDWGGKLASRSPCDGMAGRQEAKCQEQQNQAPVSSTQVARPLQDALTNALVVKPYMLLQYGRVLDPAQASDAAAYAVHLKWVSGGYKASGTRKASENYCDRINGPAGDYCERKARENPPADDPCSLVWGPAKSWCQREDAQLDADCEALAKPSREACERGNDAAGAVGALPALTPGGELLDSASAIVSEQDQEFAAFLADLKRAGPVGKACAAYAEKPTWWRVGGAVLLLVAALFICGMLLSGAIVLLATQGICAAAAAAGGVVFVAGMLPGPPRQSVWKWLSLWGIAMITMVAICAFIPFFAIAVDATITDGPDLMVERILLIDVLAIAGAAAHRRLLSGVTSFGQRMAMRMRYAKVGGTHLPGDTSELGAALAMNSPAALHGYGGLRGFALGGGGLYGRLGTRHRLLGALASLADGAGLPVDTARILTDATAEAGRGLAPLTAAAAAGGLGARIGAKGAYGLLIGRRPDKEQLAKWRKATADGDADTGGPPPAGDGLGVSGPRRPGGPPDRYRNEEGEIVDGASGEILHDQHSDRTLLSTRAHNRLVRLRGYRILHRGGRAAYGVSVALPANVQRARAHGSRYSQDARQQVRVWGNTLRADGRAWGDAARHASQVMRERTNDSGGTGPFVRRLPTRPAARTSGSSSSPGGTGAAFVPAGTPAATSSGPRPGAPPPASTPPRPSSAPPARSRPVFPGGAGASSSTREEARARFRELLRRTAPEGEHQGGEQERPAPDGEEP
ncbi:hypothetical protein ACFU96_44040 [Streptomyces sp. NPDC057620]|uniref:hypothetical protein n=1 Tax=Streptomyces sp. NPDC057620 TaxID=3346185 RepID=UPI0036C59D2B